MLCIFTIQHSTSFNILFWSNTNWLNCKSPDLTTGKYIFFKTQITHLVIIMLQQATQRGSLQHLRLQNEGPIQSTSHSQCALQPTSTWLLWYSWRYMLSPLQCNACCSRELFGHTTHTQLLTSEWLPHAALQPPNFSGLILAWDPKISQGMAKCCEGNHIWGVRPQHWAFLCYPDHPRSYKREQILFFF